MQKIGENDIHFIGMTVTFYYITRIIIRIARLPILVMCKRMVYCRSTASLGIFRME